MRATRRAGAVFRAVLLPSSGRRRLSSDTSGARTLGAVVRELRRDGKLPSSGSGFQPQSETPAWVSEGFLDIDSELAAGLAEADEVEEYPASAYHHEVLEQGGADEDEADLADAAFAREEAEGVKDRVRASAIEDVSHLGEDELRERVRRSIEDLIPSDTKDGEPSAPSTQDLSGLTPAQVFYMENREKLVNRAQQYYLEKQRELQLQQEEGVPAEVEDEWRYYHEPVVRPPRGHLWSTGEDGNLDDHGTEQGWLETTHLWPRGSLPTAEMLADLLRSEQARDVYIVDLEKCGRRDIGTYGITATGVTSQHCRRLGEIVAKATQACRVPHVEAFCYGTRRDEWVVGHCGPIKVHIFTRETREEYNLDVLWETPEQFFQPGDFAHYVEIYGSATGAFLSPSGAHVTEPGGARSTSYLPPPFRDTLHAQLMLPDYDAAEDAHYVSSANIVDVSARTGAPTARSWPDASQEPDLDDGLPPLRPAPARGAPRRPPLGDESDTDEEVEEASAQVGRRSRRRGRSEKAPLDRL